MKKLVYDLRKQKHLAIALSLLAGFLTAIIMRLNAALAEHVGILESSFLVHFIGTLFAVIILNKSLNTIFLSKIKSTPLHLFCGGILGTFIVCIANYVTPKLGVTLSLATFITINLFFSTMADHFGFYNLQKFRLTKRRIIGLFFTIIGLIILIWS